MNCQLLQHGAVDSWMKERARAAKSASGGHEVLAGYPWCHVPHARVCIKRKHNDPLANAQDSFNISQQHEHWNSQCFCCQYSLQEACCVWTLRRQNLKEHKQFLELHLVRRPLYRETRLYWTHLYRITYALYQTCRKPPWNCHVPYFTLFISPPPAYYGIYWSFLLPVIVLLRCRKQISQKLSTNRLRNFLTASRRSGKANIKPCVHSLLHDPIDLHCAGSAISIITAAIRRSLFGVS